MEKQAPQEAVRKNAQPERDYERTARRTDAQISASRAAILLNLGASLDQMRPEDVLALGARIGNSALEMLLSAGPRLTVDPFVYVPAPAALTPFELRTQEPPLCKVSGIVSGGEQGEAFAHSDIGGL